MIIFKLVSTSPEFNLIVVSIGYDVAVKDDVGIVQGRLDFGLQLVVELNLRVLQTFQVADTFGVDERDVLLLGIVYPEDKVGIEVAGLEKAYTFAAFVAQQIDFLAFQQAIFVFFIILADVAWNLFVGVAHNVAVVFQQFLAADVVTYATSWRDTAWKRPRRPRLLRLALSGRG